MPPRMASKGPNEADWELYQDALWELGLTARRGPKNTRRGPKVQRGPNFKFNFRPRSALDHAEFMHMQRIYKYFFNIKFKVFKK